MRKIYPAGFTGKLVLFFFLLTFSFGSLRAQIDIAIGTGTTGNSTTSYPAPFGDWWEGSRQQYLFLASELNGAGLSAGTINAIKFNVQALTTSTGANPAVEQFTIKIGTTSVGSLGTTTWETVAATVFGPVNHVPVLGINTFAFSAPFFWNGTSNLVVEVCSGDPNNPSDTYFTNNSVIPWTTGLTFNASRVYAADNGGNLCGTTLTTNGSATTTATTRPNLIFNWTSAGPCTTPPQAGNATATPNSVCGGTPVNLSISGASFGSGQTYQWESSTNLTGPYLPIGAVATTPFYTITAPSVTTYYRAAVTCSGNTQTSVPVEVFVNSAAPTPAITSTPTGNVCNGVSVALSTDVCQGCTYLWSTGATTNNISVNAAGLYTVTVSNSCGTAAVSKEVTLDPSPSLSISTGTSLCLGSSVQIDANGASTYSWSPATGLNTTTGASVIASPTTTTTYTVTGNIGSCSRTMSVTITVNTVPTAPSLSAGTATTFCQGGSVTISSSAATGNQWFKDGVAISGATNQTYSATASGSYTSKITTNGCTSNASVATAVTVTPLPAQPTITQNGNSLQSSAATGNQWFLNGVAITGATSGTYAPTAGGQYSVQVTSNGCTGTASSAFNFVITATNDPVLDRKITIAPNPVRDNLTIRYTGTAGKFSVLLVNMHGAVLSRSSFTSIHELDMRRYSAGMYIIEIVNERTHEKIQRVIVKQ
ncbi:MAG: T9SS type A sorting domain-containing protein [Chitinophagaceae bacterium]|nr:T9SS type A sorting domain-containing protein [Chitinophagaceae bacterium]